VALFKKKSDDGNTSNGTDKTVETFTPDPEKAQKWFDHARAKADSSSYEGALLYYASGIKFDPERMSVHEAMLDLAAKFNSTGKKSSIQKDIKKLDDGTPVARFAAAELAWLTDLMNGSLALKAIEAAKKADQIEWGSWIAPTVYRIVVQQKKLTKATMLHAKEVFSSVEAWNEALNALQKAIELDPRDAELQAELKNLSAQRAMSQGGYEQSAGREGGFRDFVKDARKQQELIEGESISGGADVEERNFNRALAAYEENPTNADVINSYAQQLKRRDDDVSLEQARDVYLKGFKDTKEYRFRVNAGDVEIQLLQRRMHRAEAAFKAHPEDGALKQAYQDARTEWLELQAKELAEHTEKYPTNNDYKQRYGEVLFELGRYDEAMACFQSSKQEPKYRVRAGHRLGRCFAHEGWYSEAIEEYREALNSPDLADADTEQRIRYDLMTALLEHARVEQSIDIAEDAKSICSEIARKDITYRDIRNKRKEVDELIRELRGS